MRYAGEEKQPFNNRSGDLEETISPDTAIFVPVITATYVIGDRYEGTTLENEVQIRNAARKDIRLGGDMWARIKEQKENSWIPIAKNLKEYKIESPLFRLKVSERNPFLPHLEVPLEPGDYDAAVVVGYFLLIKKLDKGKYRIQFGAKGRGDYRTDAVYDILVEGPELKDFTVDRSNSAGQKLGQQMRSPIDHELEFYSP
jgi:hypothetical protein